MAPAQAPAQTQAQGNLAFENRLPSTRPAHDAGDRAGIPEPTVKKSAVVPSPGSGTVSSTASPPRRFGIAFGPALLGGTGGIAPIASAAVIGRAEITERAGLEIMALFPLVPVRLSNAAGSSQISVAVFGAGGSSRLTSVGPWIGDAGVGVSAVLLRAVGDPSAQVDSGTVAIWAIAAQARLGGGLAITSWLTARVDVIGGATARHILIAYFNEKDNVSHVVAAWGRAFAAGTAGLQATW